MESMNLLDVTIKYFNVIVFVMCVLFGMTSFFASWIAWRELHRKRNIIRSVIAAYNIAEDTVEKGRRPNGELQLDPAIVQTVFNSLQEILNSVYGEITGRPIPPRADRVHGKDKTSSKRGLMQVFRRDDTPERIDSESEAPTLLPDTREDRRSASAR